MAKHSRAAAAKRGGEPPPSPRKANRLDVGIRKTVQLFQREGIETSQSCEGGKGHSYAEPTIAFHGEPEAGFRCLALCLAYGLPVQDLRRVWSVDEGEPTGPIWEITFRRRPG